MASWHRLVLYQGACIYIYVCVCVCVYKHTRYNRILGWVVDNTLKEMWKEVVVPKVRQYLGFCLEALSKTTTNLSQDSKWSVRYSNRRPPDYKSYTCVNSLSWFSVEWSYGSHLDRKASFVVVVLYYSCTVWREQIQPGGLIFRANTAEQIQPGGLIVRSSIAE